MGVGHDFFDELKGGHNVFDELEGGSSVFLFFHFQKRFYMPNHVWCEYY